MRTVGRMLVIGLMLVVALMVLKAVVFPLVALAFKMAILGALAAGGFWAYRRLSSGGKQRSSLSSGRNRGSLDMQYIRGKIDRDTYMRRKTMER